MFAESLKVRILLFATVIAAPTWAQEIPPDIFSIRPNDLTWQESTVGWDKAELYGDMTSSEYSVVRLRMPPNWEAPVHKHVRTKLEVVRVLKGILFLAFGEDSNRESAVEYGPESFIVYAEGTSVRMFTGDEEVLVEITHLPRAE